MRTVRIALVAAAPLVQAGLARAVQAHATLELATTAPTFAALQVQLARRPALQVDVAVVDLSTAAAHDTPSLTAALSANVGLVVLSDAEPAALLPLAAAGAACLPANANDREITAAVDAVAAGLVAMRSDLFNEMLRQRESGPAQRAPAELVEPLTPRELQVLRLLAGGHANKRIAVDLGISEHTAKFHVGRILDKLDAATRAEAVAIGLRDRLIDAA